MDNGETVREKDIAQIKAAIIQEYDDAEDFKFEDVGREIYGGRAYYVEFDTKHLDDDDQYYYVYVDDHGCRKLDGEDEVITFFEGLHNRNRKFIHKLREFEILDVVTAILAFSIVAAYVLALFVWHPQESPWQDGLQGTVALVIGYYFGRAKS